MKELRLVQVLHKCETLKDGGPDGDTLAVGKTFKFQDGSAYTVQSSGAVVRANPKPWKSKGERKRFLRERRADREQAISNLRSQISKPDAGKGLVTSSPDREQAISNLGSQISKPEKPLTPALSPCNGEREKIKTEL